MDEYRNTPNDESQKYKRLSSLFLILSVILALLLVISIVRTSSTKKEWKSRPSFRASLTP